MSTLEINPRSAHQKDAYENLLRRCAELEPIATAVAYPCEKTALTGAIEAAEKKLIRPILVGPKRKIVQVAREANLNIDPYRIEDVEEATEAAARAVELVRKAEAEILMKGSLHTDELLGAVVPSATGLRTSRRISHAFVMSVPTYPKAARPPAGEYPRRRGCCARRRRHPARPGTGSRGQ